MILDVTHTVPADIGLGSNADGQFAAIIWPPHLGSFPLNEGILAVSKDGAIYLFNPNSSVVIAFQGIDAMTLQLSSERRLIVSELVGEAYVHRETSLSLDDALEIYIREQ